MHLRRSAITHLGCFHGMSLDPEDPKDTTRKSRAGAPDIGNERDPPIGYFLITYDLGRAEEIFRNWDHIAR